MCKTACYTWRFTVHIILWLINFLLAGILNHLQILELWICFKYLDCICLLLHFCNGTYILPPRGLRMDVLKYFPLLKIDIFLFVWQVVPLFCRWPRSVLVGWVGYVWLLNDGTSPAQQYPCQPAALPGAQWQVPGGTWRCSQEVHAEGKIYTHTFLVWILFVLVIEILLIW